MFRSLEACSPYGFRLSNLQFEMCVYTQIDVPMVD